MKWPGARDDLTRQQHDRMRLLRAIYDATKDNTNRAADPSVLGLELGLRDDEITVAMNYMLNGHWVRDTASPPKVGITGDGIEQLQRWQREEVNERRQRTILCYTRITVILTVVGIIVTALTVAEWREAVGRFFRWAMAALKGP